METSPPIHSNDQGKKSHPGKGAPFFKPVIQAKLSINEPGDQYEREADAMADKVMRMADVTESQRTFFSAASNMVNRKCQHCEEEEKHVHRKESSTGDMHSNTELDTYVGSLNSSGQPMSQSSRRFFEPRFGRDFSDVRVHTDSLAAKSAQSINALAYTSGDNIVFNAGAYSPETDSGKKLLAHELTHVVQQGKGVSPKIQRLGDLSKAPPMPCRPAVSSPSASVLSSMFPTLSSTLSTAQKNNIDAFVRNWRANGGTDPLRVDGYASVPGRDELNWPLSCERALSVVNELRNNSVPDGMITFFAQGETTEFGPQANNQTANISLTGSQRAMPSAAPVTPGAAPVPAPGTVPEPINPHIPSGSLCRGACGPDCPPTCTPLADIVVCLPDSTGQFHYTYTYRHVVQCGSHLGCRVHDACYDACDVAGDTFGTCHRGCDIDCVNTYSFSLCNGWRQGHGPFDRMLRFSDPAVVLGPVAGGCPP